MEKLDHVIGSAFSSMRKGKKKEDKEKMGQLKAYKMRCFDLLDILIQNENTDVRYLVVSFPVCVFDISYIQKFKLIKLKYRCVRKSVNAKI